MGKIELTFIVAGLLGGAIRAFAQRDQTNLSWRSLVDVLAGGAFAVLYPILPEFGITALPSIPETWSITQRFVVMALAATGGSTVVMELLEKYTTILPRKTG